MQSTILYHGPAAAPYRGTVTAVLFRSLDNPKTGPTLAIAILPGTGMTAVSDRTQGEDGACCGACPFRSVAGGGNGGCYVSSVALMGYTAAARSAWQADAHGFPSAWPMRHGRPLPLRLGAYGDPAALPAHVIRSVRAHAGASGAHVWGYTHGWAKRPDLADMCMASVESSAGQARAVAKGWRVYRIVRDASELATTGLQECESSTGLACVDCRKCAGTGAAADNGRAIIVHGPSAKRAASVIARLAKR